MKTITRYVLSELTKVFLVTLSVMTALMLIFGVAKEAVSEGLGLVQILQLVPYILPDALRFTIPGTVLFAVASVYGRMAGSNEIVALKSMGISPWAVLWPAYVLTILVSAATVVLNDVAVSWGRAGVRTVIIEAVEQVAYSRLKLHGEFSSPQFTVNVRDVQGKELIQPTFTMQNPRKPDETLTIRCASAELSTNPDDGVLTVTFFDGYIKANGVLDVRFPGQEFKRDIDLESLRIDGHDWSPSWMPFSQLREQLIVRRDEYGEHRREMVAKAALQTLTGDFYALTDEEWDTEARVHREIDFLIHRLETEPPRRWSNGFSCLCFALVGGAVAIRRRNASFLSSFFVCFLPILAVYYPLLAFGVQQAKNGSLPPEIVWLGNGVLLVWGAWELRRVIRY
ncbi:MAG: LptF/LptG family permease [Pirellulales bacterium]|nr:LptF/LptG family permease [Pirellulales bacterium]